MLLAVSAIFTAACGSSATTTTAPTTTRCAVAAQADTPVVASGGGSGRLTITVNRECAWEVVADVPWIGFATERAGQGSASVDYSVPANPQSATRRGVILVNDTRVEITQAASPCLFTLSQTSERVGAAGGAVRVDVAALSDCGWTAASQAEWIRVVTGTSASGGGSVQLDISPNPNGARSGIVAIAGQAFVVVQDGALPGPDPGASGPTPPGTTPPPTTTPPPPPPTTDPTPTPPLPAVTCTYAVSPPTQTLASSGGTGVATVATGPSCPWTAVSTANWLTLSSATSGSGAATVSFSVLPNTGPSARTAIVAIAGQGVAVTQLAADTPAPQPCSFDVTPASLAVGAASSMATFAVAASAETCAWTATTTAPWLTPEVPGGSGTGQVVVTIAANTSETPREAAVVIAGRSIPVSQAGTAPPPPGCQLSVAPTSQSVGAGGGPGQVAVTASDGSCTWTATSSAPWITVTSGAQSTGSGIVSYAVAANDSTSPRTGSLTVAGQTVTITQAGADAPPPTCAFTVAPTSASAGAGGGPGQVAVTASDGSCTWTATSSAPWITVTSGAQGMGSGTVSFAVAANESTSPRTGTLTVAGQTVTVTQAGAEPPPPTCAFTVAPTSQSVGAGGGPGQVAVTASDGSCTWTATSSAPWITVTTGAQGTGSGTVSYTVAANTSTAPRTGTLTVAGQTVTVTQAGAEAPPPTCAFTVAPTSQSVGAGGGPGQVAVTATDGSCTWTATSSAPWITVTTGAQGTGSGTVSYTVAANESTSPRTGTLTVAGQTVTVTQDGRAESEVTVSGNVGMFAGACPNVTFRVMGQPVSADGSTVYTAGSCGDLRNGVGVVVHGVMQPDGRIRATRVQVQP